MTMNANDAEHAGRPAGASYLMMREGLSQRAMVLWAAAIEAAVLIPVVVYVGCFK
jgi:hypothetical protein